MKTSIRSTLALVVALLILVPAGTRAQGGYDLFQKALAAERAEGKLNDAIALYQRIVREFSTDRALVAKALVQMGHCYEKQGKAEARKAYERVVREFADQPEAAEARARLAALTEPSRAVPASAVVARRITDDPTVDQLGTPSPDGRFLSTTDWGTGDLAVIDTATGQKRRVTNKGSWNDSQEFALFSAFSPDGKRIAYAWFNKAQKFELRVIDAEGTSPRVLYFNEKDFLAWPTAWTPDGNSVLAPIARQDGSYQIALISAADGTVRVLKTSPQSPGGGIFEASISPDGRYVVYDYPSRQDAPEHDIFLVPVEGGREVPLVRHAADDLFPVWAPDGQSVVFISDRTGTLGLWRIRVANGKPQGPEELLKQDAGRVMPIGFSSKGSFYYSLEAGLIDVYTATLDLAAGKITASSEPISQRFIGARNMPHWSPDGKYLVSVSARGALPAAMGSHTLSIFSSETGRERDLALNLQNVRRPRWSPDAREILIHAFDTQGRQGLFRVDARTGETSTVFLNQPGITSNWGTWARDGKSVFFVRSDNTKPTATLIQRDLQTGEEKELFHTSQPISLNTFELSPDGQQAVLHLFDRTTSTGTLKLLPVAGGEPRDLYQVQGPSRIMGSTQPVWTPDGKDILFLRLVQPSPNPRQSAFEIWRVSVETGKAEKLGPPMENISNITLHPDGKRLAFQAGQSKIEIWVMENLLPAAPRKPK